MVFPFLEKNLPSSGHRSSVSDPWLAACFCWVGKAAPTPVWLVTFCACCWAWGVLPLMWKDLSRARGRCRFVFLRTLVLEWYDMLGFPQSKPGNVWLTSGDKSAFKKTTQKSLLSYDTAHMSYILLATVLKNPELWLPKGLITEKTYWRETVTWS